MRTGIVIIVQLAALVITCRLGSCVVFPDKSIIYTANTTKAFLSVAPQPEVWITEYNTTRFAEFIFMNSSMQSMIGGASDANEGHMVFSDPIETKLVIFDVNAASAIYFHLGTSKGVILPRDTEEETSFRDVGQLTIDWRARNIYWTDTGYRWLAMKQLPDDISTINTEDATFKLVVDKYLENPTGVVVDPHKFFLFWADAGSTPKIERSDMVGGNRRMITFHALIHPTTLVIDGTKDRLYWADAGRGTIEYSDYDGKGRAVLASDPDRGYYGIAVFQNALFYTTKSGDKNGFYSLKDSTFGTELANPFDVRSVADRFYHVIAYDKDSQPKDPNELCALDHEDVKCDQICVHMQELVNTCYCRDGYELQLDGTNCAGLEVIERHLLFTSETSICSVNINVVSIPSALVPMDCSVVPSTYGTITRFAFNTLSKQIFFTNGTAIFQHDVFSTSDATELYRSTTTDVIDMDHDWTTQELFWVQENEGLVYSTVLTELDIQTHTLSTNGVITNIAVDPHNGNLYFIEKTTTQTYKLYAWDRSSGSSKTLVMTSLLSTPTDLEYDRLRNRLVWNDGAGYIGFISEDGSNERQVATSHTGKARHAVTVYKNYVIVSTSENRQFDILYEIDSSYYHMDILENGATVLDMHVFDSTLQPPNLEECEINNGGCSDICMQDQDTYTCSCKLGYSLAGDGKQCLTENIGPSDSDYFVVLDEVHSSIYQIGYDGEIHAIEINEANEPGSLAVDSNTHTVAWVDKKAKRIKSKIIGQAKEKAFEINVDDAGASIAIDSSTGNIFVALRKDILVLNDKGNRKTLIDRGLSDKTIGKIAVLSLEGKMAWVEKSVTVGFIYMANMDGTSEVQVYNEHGASVDDIMFDVDLGNSLYWCESTTGTVWKYEISTSSTTKLYTNSNLPPIAIDVKGQDIFIVLRNERKIIKIDKQTGQGQETMFETPLIGSMDKFYVARPSSSPVHAVCSDCNGECSDLCLPRGEIGRACACSDGDSLKPFDLTTCASASRCPLFDADDVVNLVNCCPGQPNAACGVMCSDGYSHSGSGGVKCQHDTWNASVDAICIKDKEVVSSSPLPLTTIAGGTAGGVGFIIILVAVFCYMRRQRSPMKSPNAHMPLPRGGSTISTIDRGHGHAGMRLASPDPPPRLTPEEEKDGGVYHDLDEAAMNAKYVHLPPEDVKKTDAVRKDSGRYLSFPLSNDYQSGQYIDFNSNPNAAYMHPVSNSDYDQRNLDHTSCPIHEDKDGYLESSSVSGGSRRGSQWEDFASNGSRHSLGHVDLKPSGGYHSNGSVSYSARGPAPVAHSGDWQDRSKRGNSRSGSGHGSDSGSGYSTRIIRQF